MKRRKTKKRLTQSGWAPLRIGKTTRRSCAQGVAPTATTPLLRFQVCVSEGWGGRGCTLSACPPFARKLTFSCVCAHPPFLTSVLFGDVSEEDEEEEEEEGGSMISVVTATTASCSQMDKELVSVRSQSTSVSACLCLCVALSDLGLMMPLWLLPPPQNAVRTS